MYRKGNLICIIGIDGTGKTTIAKKIVKLISKNNQSKYIHCRYYPILLMPCMLLAKVFLYRGVTAKSNYSGYSKLKRNFLSGWKGSIYKNLLLIDFWVQVLLKVTLPLFITKKIFVCDRYLHDTIFTDLAADVGLSNYDCNKLLERLFILFPKPDLCFLLDIKEDIAFSRKDDTISLEYLKERRGLYLSYANINNLDVIKCDKKSIDEVFAELYNKISRSKHDQ